MRRVLSGLAGLVLVALAHAHPLGNNTVNRQAAIHVSGDAVAVRYLVDLAEIPTLLAATEADSNGDGNTSVDEWKGHARRYGEQIRDGVDVRVDGHPVALTLERTKWELVPGAAELNTLRIEVLLSTPLSSNRAMKIEYRDHRRPDEQGWKEVFFHAGSDVRVDAADVARESLSRDLTTYPAPGGEVPNVLTASAQVLVIPAEIHPARVPNDQGATPRARKLAALDTHDTGPGVRQQPPTLAPEYPGPVHATVSYGPGQSTPGGHTETHVSAFFRLGVHHIATGWDHLVFLLGLIVAQRSLRKLVWVVTAFTAAHSLTLGLAASGLVSPPGNWVEPAIALTIAYVGLANLLGRMRHGAAVAFAFGLVHGFGFAGALAESLEGARIGGRGWLFDLAAFNLGIEAFQLLLVAALLPAIRFALRQSWSEAACRAVSVAIMGAGIGWFVNRI